MLRTKASPEPLLSGTLASVVANIQRILEHEGDAQAVESQRRVMPGIARMYGVPMPLLRQLAASLAKEGQQDLPHVLAVLDALWANGSLEERQIVGKVLERLGRHHPEECLAAVERFLPSLDGWANCDNLACFSMKEVALGDPAGTVTRCRRWVQHPLKWVRRFGVVVLRAFEKRAAPDGVFEVLDALRDEKDPDVQKGVAWICRDLSLRHPKEVFALLSSWATSKGSEGRVWMLREGLKRLPPRQRERLKVLLPPTRPPYP